MPLDGMGPAETSIPPIETGPRRSVRCDGTGLAAGGSGSWRAKWPGWRDPGEGQGMEPGSRRATPRLHVKNGMALV